MEVLRFAVFADHVEPQEADGITPEVVRDVKRDEAGIVPASGAACDVEAPWFLTVRLDGERVNVVIELLATDRLVQELDSDVVPLGGLTRELVDSIWLLERSGGFRGPALEAFREAALEQLPQLAS